MGAEQSVEGGEKQRRPMSAYVSASSDSDCSRSPSPSPEPSDEQRLTIDSPQFWQQLKRCRIKTRRFKDCTKLQDLQDSVNYSEWHADLMSRARGSDLQDLLTGKEEEPVLLDQETDSILEWNQFLLAVARWTARNETMMGHLMDTISPNLWDFIEICSQPSGIMKAIEKARPLASVDSALSTFNELHDYTFDETRPFDEFHKEFEKRFKAYNDLHGGFGLDENHKCMLFMRALGPSFKDYVCAPNDRFDIAGFGTGTGIDLGFQRLRNGAYNKWIDICAKRRREAKKAAGGYIPDAAKIRRQKENRAKRMRRYHERKQLKMEEMRGAA